MYRYIDLQNYDKSKTIIVTEKNSGQFDSSIEKLLAKMIQSKKMRTFLGKQKINIFPLYPPRI